MNCLKCKSHINQSWYNILEESMIQNGSNCFPLMEYSEEKIIFDLSDIIPGKTYSSCLDLNMSIKYGEYKCNPRPDKTFYVLNGINNTGLIKDCNIACNSCYDEGNSQNTNCINCANGYFKTEESNTNCILENLIPLNYYKNLSDNIYYKCHPNCYNCTKKYDLSLNDMHCLSCISNNYFLYKKNNCYDMNFTLENKNFYFSNEDFKFHKCYNTCSECLPIESNEEKNYCIKCISDFYFLENTSNCFNISLLNRGYYLDINTTFKKCYENCKLCSDYYINNDMNCITCQEGFYKLNGTNNCFNISLINSGYYLQNDVLYQCHENCLTCSNGPSYIFNNNSNIITNISNNCLSCDKDNKGLYLVEDLKNCENINYTLNGYYLDHNESGIDILKKCYKNCKTCNQGLIYDNFTQSYNHNCLECAENYYKIKNGKNANNCYGNEMLLLNYSLENNMWKICHDNCFSCYGKPFFDENDTLVSQNCINCLDNYNLMFDTKDCYNDSIIE